MQAIVVSLVISGFLASVNPKNLTFYGESFKLAKRENLYKSGSIYAVSLRRRYLA